MTWRTSKEKSREWAGLPAECVIELVIDESSVATRFPNGPHLLGLSYILSETIVEAVDRLEIDVVETSDFQSPALFAFTELRNRSSDRSPLCVTFNHGLTGDVYAAASLRMSQGALAESVGERQQMRESDLVIAPSHHAARHLKRLGIDVRIEVVPEPFLFDHKRVPSELTPSVVHLGRVSFAKGVDRLVYYANFVDEFMPIDQLLFIGSLVPEPFKGIDIREYVLGRLNTNLRERTAFTGPLQRDAARRLLPMGGLAPQFSLSRHFSYRFLETFTEV